MMLDFCVQSLPKDDLSLCTVGQMPAVKRKNRFYNVIPCEFTSIYENSVIFEHTAFALPIVNTAFHSLQRVGLFPPVKSLSNNLAIPDLVTLQGRVSYFLISLAKSSSKSRCVSRIMA